MHGERERVREGLNEKVKAMGKGRVQTELCVGEVGGGEKRDHRSKRSGVNSFLLILFTEFHIFIIFFYTLHIFK